MELLGEVLGGSFGARLPTEVRVKRGLAYSVNGYIGWNYAYPGMLTAFAQTKNESTAEVIKVMTDEIAKIKSPQLSDMGKIIGAVRGRLGAGADGATIAKLVKAQLEQK